MRSVREELTEGFKAAHAILTEETARPVNSQEGRRSLARTIEVPADAPRFEELPDDREEAPVRGQA